LSLGAGAGAGAGAAAPSMSVWSAMSAEPRDCRPARGRAGGRRETKSAACAGYRQRLTRCHAGAALRHTRSGRGHAQSWLGWRR
jgi:hypothetical protein